MCDYAAWLRRPPRVVTRFPVNRRRVERIIQRHLKTREYDIGEVAAKDILRAYDFNVPPGQLAATADEAVEAAGKLGYPVAMKIVSPDIIHKSDVGGVKLNLNSPDGGARRLRPDDAAHQRSGCPSARIDGVYVEKMCERGREVILGMTRDPQFGPMLMFGLGGIFVEVMKDVTFHLAPITQDEAMQMLESTKSFALLKGVRGEAGVDLDAIATSLQRISQLVTDFPADRGNGHQPVHRRRGRPGVRGRRCAHHAERQRSAMIANQTAVDPNWQETYSELIATAEQAVKRIRPGQRVFIGTGCAQPQELVHALVARGRELADT